MAARETLLLQILLVVVLGFVEGHGGNNLSCDGLAETVGLFERFFGGAGGGFLLWGGEENGGAILAAVIRALTVDLGGIVVLPEHFEQLFVGQLGRVVGDFYCFSVASAVGADFFVGGVAGLASGIAYAGRDDAGQLAERGFDSQKHPAAKMAFDMGRLRY